MKSEAKILLAQEVSRCLKNAEVGDFLFMVPFQKMPFVSLELS